MKNKQPLISIVTVVYNGEEFLEKTIQSVINQTYKNIEYIIIDGGSSDRTVDIIKKYENKIDYWVSEKDAGIYDAMNKGLDIATGDFVNFMNGGDSFYTNNTVSAAVAMMDSYATSYFGRAEVISDYSSWLHPSAKIDKTMIDMWLKKEAPNHQATFFPKVFYKKEKYNLEYNIFADGDYKNRAKFMHGFCFLDIIICKFEFGGISSSFDSYKHVIMMMKEAWNMGLQQKRVLFSIKRIFIYNIKYVLQTVFGERILLKLLRRYRG